MPDTGTRLLDDDSLKEEVGVGNWAFCGLFGTRAKKAAEDRYGQTADTGGTKQDAIRHSYWNFLSASLMGVKNTVLITTANEHTGRLKQKALASNSTMDLFNNNFGANAGAKYNLPDYDKEKAIKELESAFDKGELRAWTPPNKAVNTHDNILRKSNQEKIYKEQ